MKILILLLLLAPAFSFAQNSHYDSLFNKGVISKEDYDLLKKSNAVDSNQQKLDRYDSLYKAHQISKDDYKILTDNILRNAINPDLNYDPLKERRRGDNQVTAGAICLVGGLASTGIFLLMDNLNIKGVNHSITTKGVVLGLGVGLDISGLVLIINGSVIKSRARKYQAQKK